MSSASGLITCLPVQRPAARSTHDHVPSQARPGRVGRRARCDPTRGCVTRHRPSVGARSRPGSVPGSLRGGSTGSTNQASRAADVEQGKVIVRAPLDEQAQIGGAVLVVVAIAGLLDDPAHERAGTGASPHPIAPRSGRGSAVVRCGGRAVGRGWRAQQRTGRCSRQRGGRCCRCEPRAMRPLLRGRGPPALDGVARREPWRRGRTSSDSTRTAQPTAE